MGTKREKKLSGDKTKGQKPLLQKIQELGETEKTVENDWEQKPKNKTYFYVNSGGLKKENKTTGETQEQQTPTGPWISKLKFTERRNERRRGETKSNLAKLLELKSRKPKIFWKLKN